MSLMSGALDGHEGHGSALLQGGNGRRLDPRGSNWFTWKVLVAAILIREWHVVDPTTALAPAPVSSASAPSASASGGDVDDKKGGMALSAEDSVYARRAYSVIMQLLSEAQLMLVAPPLVA